MYLFVARARGLEAVPKVLLEQCGKLLHVSDMILDPKRPLARADVSKVMDEVRDKGFYLQMPPPPDEDLFLAAGHPDNPRGKPS
ncbi:UPF0745 protein [Alloalcanivorax dieselolei B5]|uniref:UPF0745 protein n=2 Tax=Alloalcanivorax dieselolei TaxID=285091 RepID=K0CIC1_ALCDB|nr:UPF0745 protein [Alloalcanivorax dieselolei B5]